MFITNDNEKNLDERLKQLISSSSELKFLVGFFYFSGIDTLYETLKKLDEQGKIKEGFLKVLVGLNVDEGVYGLVENAKYSDRYNSVEEKNRYFQSIEKAFISGELDQKEIYQQVDFFKKLLLEKKLIIRKTKKPNHSKLYLFKIDENHKHLLKELFITGSSNLTRAGLKDQDEFNVEIKDYGFDEAQKYFDKLWEESTEISPDDIVKTLEKKTFLRSITPFQAYVYLLKTYIDLHQGKIPVNEMKRLENLLKEKGYKAFDYQLSAVSQAISIIQAHNGVIIADVVGLGKTVIACLTAHALNKRGIVICPPHLMGDNTKSYGWKKYLEDFNLKDWEVFSTGRLKEALEFTQNYNDIEVVIVDEAHRFRNEKTMSYSYLKEICRGKNVILLTATPFNNSPSDIFAMLKLFTVPKKSSIVYDENIESIFRKYGRDYSDLTYILKNHKNPGKNKDVISKFNSLFSTNKKDITDEDIKNVRQRLKYLSQKIRSTLEPVIIRRNRLDLKYYKDKLDYPEVKDPIEVFFELTEKQLGFYDKVIESFSPNRRFKGAIYRPSLYEKKTDEENEDNVSQQNLYEFMRTLLIKMFESSFKAFYESISRFESIYQLALEFIENTGKFVLDRDFIKSLEGENQENIIDELKKYEEELKSKSINQKKYEEKLKSKSIDHSSYIYDIDNLKDSFIKDINSDIKLFQELKQDIEDLGLLNSDPKSEKLVEEVKKYVEEKRKVVIFTEYRDTARYLKEVLERNFNGRVLSVIGDLNDKTIKDLYANFDAQYKNQEDKYDILITTDKLSEGFNLNRAGVVINYDIPWNPVRVIQRVGRINRIGKKVYDEIYILNFFPTEKGSDYVKSREIAQTKMFMIHNVLGEDAKIFSPDEEPQPSELYEKLKKLPEEDEESFFTKVKKEFEEIKEDYPEVLKEIEEIWSDDKRVYRLKTAKPSDKDEIIVFIIKGKDLFVGYHDYKEKTPKFLTFEEVFERIKSNPTTPTLKITERFWDSYEKILKRQPNKDKGSKNHGNAQRTLKILLKEENEKLNKYKQFMKDIIEDIENYHTISEYILSKISAIEKNIDEENIDKIVKEIEEIKGILGEDFLEKTIKLKNEKEEVIIAIENIREA
jgi:superfamily II DNA or RNA helicase